MLDQVERIAKLDKRDRLDGIITILNEKGLPYEIVHQKSSNHWTDNIVIPINRKCSDKRFVIAAHYDNIQGSIAANDNASGDAVLINLAYSMLRMELKVNYDIVFFDREEYVDRGSEQYIDYVGKENILGMLNIDTCGFGNCIMLGPRKNLNNDVFEFISKKVLEKHNVQLIERTPGSDDRSFEIQEIPNLSLNVVPIEDVSSILKIIECEIKGIDPFTVEGLQAPTFMETTHNGPKDRIEYVMEEALLKTYEFLMELIILQNTK